MKKILVSILSLTIIAPQVSAFRNPDYKPEININNKQELIDAISTSDIEKVEKYIAQQGDANVVLDEKGNTPLHCAVKEYIESEKIAWRKAVVAVYAIGAILMGVGKHFDFLPHMPLPYVKDCFYVATAMSAFAALGMATQCDFKTSNRKHIIEILVKDPSANVLSKNFEGKVALELILDQEEKIKKSWVLERDISKKLAGIKLLLITSLLQKVKSN